MYVLLLAGIAVVGLIMYNYLPTSTVMFLYCGDVSGDGAVCCVWWARQTNGWKDG